MKKTQFSCPCRGKIKWAKERIMQNGEKCSSKYFPEESMNIIEDKLKEKGLWVANTKKGYVYPDGKKKITIKF